MLYDFLKGVFIMKINEIVHMEDAVNETFYLDNGTYQGTITDFSLVKDNKKLLIKIKVDSEDKLYMNSSYSKYYEEGQALNPLIKEIDQLKDAIGKKVKFRIENILLDSGKNYTSIAEVRYL